MGISAFHKVILSPEIINEENIKMHIPDNYLSPETCTVLGLIALPVIGYSVKKVKLYLTEKSELSPMLGISSSFSFLLMMFNIPVPGGTTAHAVGGTLLAILIGPYAACLSITVTLILQSFLFADGGVIALGVNIFNMACVIPFVGYGIYYLFTKFYYSNLGVIVGSYVGINIGALLVAVELGIQPLIFHTNVGDALYNPYPLSVTLPAMMITHLIFLGPIESFFTYIVYQFVKKFNSNELYLNSIADRNDYKTRFLYLYLFIGILIILSPLGLLAQGSAFGEWPKEEILNKIKSDRISDSLPQGIAKGLDYRGLFSDYTIPGLNLPIGYILSAITAVIIFILIGKILGSIYGKDKN